MSLQNVNTDQFSQYRVRIYSEITLNDFALDTETLWYQKRKSRTIFDDPAKTMPPKVPLFSLEKMHAHPRSLLDVTPNFLFKGVIAVEEAKGMGQQCRLELTVPNVVAVSSR